jgi:cell wall-associated NlpC family hydrolase
LFNLTSLIKRVTLHAMFSQVHIFKSRRTPKLIPSKLMLAAVLALGLGVFQPAFALNSETTAPADDMQALLVSKGILSKIGGQIVQTSESVVQQVSERTTDLISTAVGLMGIPYLRGGNSAESGFDCSGFVRYIYKETIGLVLPRSADQQANTTQKIDRSELKPGDLVFFNTMRRTFSHVGIYLGEGKFIHSPRSGASVRIEDMRIPYWNVRFDGARRVQGDGMDTANARAISATAIAATGSTVSTSADMSPVR